MPQQTNGSQQCAEDLAVQSERERIVRVIAEALRDDELPGERIQHYSHADFEVWRQCCEYWAEKIERLVKP